MNKKKLIEGAILAVWILLVATVTYVVAAAGQTTDFSWSGPGQTGRLTYTGLGLVSPTISGTSTNGTTQINGTVTVGSSGTGYTVIFHSDVAGNEFTWTDSSCLLTLDGTNGGNVLAVTDGNVDIADNIDVDGTSNLDEVDIDGATDIDAAVTVGTTGGGAGYDVTVYATNNGDYMQYDASLAKLIVTGVDGTDGLDVTDGDVNIADDIDLGTDLDVDGTSNLDEVDIDGATDIDAALTIGTTGGGAGYDVIAYATNNGDFMQYDASLAKLIVTGIDSTDGIDLTDGDLNVADDIDLGTDLDVDGTANLDNTDIDGTLDVDGAVTVGTTGGGAGYDVTFFATNSGDEIIYDASAAALLIDGTNGGDAVTVSDGNVTITDDLDVDGTANLDIVDIDGATDIDATLTIGTTGGGAGYDVLMYATNNGDLVLWDASAARLTVTGTNGGNALVVADGNFDIVDEGSVDNKYIAVGPDETTGLMVQSGTATISGDGSVTQAFTAAYSSALPVVATYSQDPGSAGTNAIYITSNTGTNFVINGSASKGVYWISVGTRP